MTSHFNDWFEDILVIPIWDKIEVEWYRKKPSKIDNLCFFVKTVSESPWNYMDNKNDFSIEIYFAKHLNSNCK
jgi:hypothetical protein